MERTRWFIRCVAIPVGVPAVLLHLPTCADTLDQAPHVSDHVRCQAASGNNVQIAGGSVHPAHLRSSAKPRSRTCMRSVRVKSGDKVGGVSAHTKPTRANDERWPRSPGCDASDAGVAENAASSADPTSPPSGQLRLVPNSSPSFLPCSFLCR